MSRSNTIHILILLVFLHSAGAQDSTTVTSFTTNNETESIQTESTTMGTISTSTVINESTIEFSSTTPIFTEITTPTTTTTTGGEGGGSDDTDLALILGLSLGIGIPVVILLVGGTLYYFLVYRKNAQVNPTNSPTETESQPAKNEIPLRPKSSERPSSAKKTADS